MRFEDGAEVVRARSFGSCEACGKRRGTQTHHRQPRGMGGVSGIGMAVNDPSALIRVCGLCHSGIESRRTLAESLGLLVRRPTVPAGVPVWLNTINGRGWWLLGDDGGYLWVDRPAPEVTLS